MHITLEKASNVALIVTCLLTSTVVASRYVRSGPTASDGPMLPFSVGEQMTDIGGIRYQQSAATLVLYAKSTCPYCSVSMPFYRQLLDLPVMKARQARFVVASAEPTQTMTTYLQQYGITPDQVTKGDAARPTPTLVLVDRTGTIRGTWIGKQKPDSERELMNRLNAVAGHAAQ